MILKLRRIFCATLEVSKQSGKKKKERKPKKKLCLCLEVLGA